MQFEKYSSLKLTLHGTILQVSFHNPGCSNAVNGAMHTELAQVFREIAREATIDVVILSGSPEGGAFCLGGDPIEMSTYFDAAASGEGFSVILRDGMEVASSFCALPQPVIAMINGNSDGLGTTLALLSDISFMQEDALISDKHVLNGVVAGDGGAAIWPFLIGPNRAKEFLMTGMEMTGRKAASLGLINHAVPAEELEARAFAFAERLAAGPKLAIQLTKKSVNLLVGAFVNQVLAASLAMEGITFNTADARKAIALMAEARTKK